MHPRKLTWNLKMEVWKIIFLFNWMIFSGSSHHIIFWGVFRIYFPKSEVHREDIEKNRFQDEVSNLGQGSQLSRSFVDQKPLTYFSMKATPQLLLKRNLKQIFHISILGQLLQNTFLYVFTFLLK